MVGKGIVILIIINHPDAFFQYTQRIEEKRLLKNINLYPLAGFGLRKSAHPKTHCQKQEDNQEP